MEKYLIFILVIIFVAAIATFTGEELIEELENQTITCDPPYILNGTTCCSDENENGVCDEYDVEMITQNLSITEDDIIFLLDTFEWSIFQQRSCERCVENPTLFECKDLVKPLDYECSPPEGDTQMNCIAHVNGTKHNKEYSFVCDDSISTNQIFVSLAQVNHVKVCCTLIYWDYPQQKYVEGNTVCRTIDVDPPCEIE